MSRVPATTFAMMTVAIVLTAGAATPTRLAQAGSDRVTASFELEDVQAVLREVARIFDGGFTRADADRLAAEIDALAVDAEREWNLPVTYRRNAAQLAVRVRVDDLSMADFDFRAAPPIAGEIRRALDGFRSERER